MRSPSVDRRRLAAPRLRSLVAAPVLVALALAMPGLAQPVPATAVPAAPQAAIVPAAPEGAALPTPDAFFGFRMGADGKLAAWGDIERYFRQIAAASDRVELVSLGRTTEGQDLIAVVVSAPEHIARLEDIRRLNQKLADPRTLDAQGLQEAAERQPAVLAIGASIHATEIGATQAMNDLLYELATRHDAHMLEALRSLVVILIPSLNPDGHRLVVDWFEKNRGTPFEASPMPWLYHKYAGHDINRDAFMLNLAENRRYADFFYRTWHPQVFLTMHQMGTRGPRFFVPPNYDPIDSNYDPLLWRTAGLLGHAMALQLERDGRSGVVQNALFDYYWPGYEDSAPLGHNTVCLLTEAASARLAWPIEVRKDELLGSPRGLSEYRPQINFPNPWPGGTWRLRDIVDYELSAVRGLLDAAARYRRELVENFYAMGRRAIELGQAGEPFAFLVPAAQHDPHAAAALVDVLIGGGVEVHQAIEPFRAGGREYPAGTTLVLMAQPFRAYAKTLLERQAYPIRRLVQDGPPERPYDVAGWTLPDQMGVSVDPVTGSFALPALARLERATIAPGQILGDRRASYFLVDARGNAGALAINRIRAAGIHVAWTLEAVAAAGTSYPAGTLVIPATAKTRSLLDRIVSELGIDAIGMRGAQPRALAAVGQPRVGLYKPWLENIDEGWTRWLLERYEFPFVNLSDADMRAGSLRDRVDVLILPDAPPQRLVTGHAQGTIPEPYAGGLGTQGTAALTAFVRAGGTLVCLDSSCALAIEALDLPVRNVVQDIAPDAFFCPGSILRLRVDTAHPLAFGMPEETAAFFAMSSAYEPRSESAGVPAPDSREVALTSPGIRSVAWYGGDNPLLSGWIEGPEVIAGKSALVEARVGAGRAVLIGFRAQHRAQAHATFRLLFNAIYSHSPTKRGR